MNLIKDDDLWYQKEKIRRIENERKKPPTLKHLREVINTLKDFGISIKVDDIPSFNSVGDLERWQRKIILKSFN